MPVLGGTGSQSSSTASLGVSVKDYGARGDSVSRSDAVTNGSAVVTSAAGTFTSADIGKPFRVYNGGTTHATTIASVQSATQVTLAVAVPFTATARSYSYGTDDTTAIAAAIAALGTSDVEYSKTLSFPASAGWYWDTAAHDFDGSDNLQIVGEQRQFPLVDDTGRQSVWRYVADGSASFLSARGSTGFTIRNLMIQPEGQGYGGVLVNLAAADVVTGITGITFFPALDTVTFRDARDNIQGCVGVDVRGVVLASFDRCSFDRMARQVQTVTGSQTFSNVVSFRDCFFQHAFERAISVTAASGVTPRQWLFEGCTFEPLIPNSNPPILLDRGSAIAFVNTGFWDGAGAGAGGVIAQISSADTLRALSLTGCRFELGGSGTFALALKAVEGLSVVGTHFSVGGTVFKTGMTATAFQYQANSHTDGVVNNSGVTAASLTV